MADGLIKRILDAAFLTQNAQVQALFATRMSEADVRAIIAGSYTEAGNVLTPIMIPPVVTPTPGGVPAAINFGLTGWSSSQGKFDFPDVVAGTPFARISDNGDPTSPHVHSKPAGVTGVYEFTVTMRAEEIAAFRLEFEGPGRTLLTAYDVAVRARTVSAPVVTGATMHVSSSIAAGVDADECVLTARVNLPASCNVRLYSAKPVGTLAYAGNGAAMYLKAISFAGPIT